MKKYSPILLSILLPGLIAIFSMYSCKPGSEGKSSKGRKADSLTTITSNPGGTGRLLEIEMRKGKAHNHPTFAIWIEDTSGIYIQTLFVTQSFGQGIYEHVSKSGGTWIPGEAMRPAALPYWAHKRGIEANGILVPTPTAKVPDAYTGATPSGSFRLASKTDIPLKGKVKIIFEINQPWDWNEYWTNTLYPEDAEYKTSCQPAVIYSALIDMDSPGTTIELKPVGHSHYSGKTGNLYADISTITTAMHIAENITVSVK